VATKLTILPMLALGLLVVAEQSLVCRLNTSVPTALSGPGTTPPCGDPGFIGRAEASTRSLPRPSPAPVSCRAWRQIAAPRCCEEISLGQKPPPRHGKAADLRLRI
jgi:hypothetical protein